MSIHEMCQDCPHLDRCMDRFKHLEGRMDILDNRWQNISQEITLVRERLASLDGRIAGYLVAATLLGSCVAFLAAYLLRHVA